MARKPTKGYYVKGHFVAEGSELDQELKQELKGTEGLSKTDLKKESDRLQTLGESLITLRGDLMDKLCQAHELPDKLIDALEEAHRITNFEGRRRHMQYIGKLMRKLDEATVAAAEAALEEQRKPSARETLMLHQSEQWRDQLVADDEALTRWLEAFPDTDVQHLRALVRQARKDAQATAAQERPGEAQRHGKAYREIYQLVKSALAAAEAADDSGDASEEDDD